MGVLSAIKGWFSMLLRSKAQEEFNIEPISNEQMESWITECVNIYQGNPCWLKPGDSIDTINFAKTICAEIAKLATLGSGAHISGSARGDWLQKQIKKVSRRLRGWVEYGCAYGTIILKPNGDSIDLYTPGKFEVTHETNGVIDGVVFHNWEKSGDKWFTRLEYHRFEGREYVITNKFFLGDNPDDTKERVEIEKTPWAELAEEVAVSNLDTPLFGVFRTPQANNIDLDSPFGLPIFSEAVQELRDLDIAYSRNSREIKDSKRIVMIDKDRMLTGDPNGLGEIELPDFVALVDGDTSVESDIYHEINPTLNTETRVKGINFLLGLIGFKSGFSNGHFVFNEKTGRVTAREVESDDARTIQTIEDVRGQIEACLYGLICALDAFATLYKLAPKGSYEITYDFLDITRSFEEDRAHHYQLAVQGHYPWEEYYVRFLKYSREEARKLIAMAKGEQKEPTLFE